MIGSSETLGAAGVLTRALLEGRKKNRPLFARQSESPADSFIEGASSVLEFGASDEMESVETRGVLDWLGEGFLSVGRDLVVAFRNLQVHALAEGQEDTFRASLQSFIHALNDSEASSRLFVQEFFDTTDRGTRKQLLGALSSRELHQLKRVLTSPEDDAHSPNDTDRHQLTFTLV